MKYAYYTFVLLTVVLRRVLFPLVFVAIPFRKNLRNTVYNYHLNNNIKLKRLYERTPTMSGQYWILSGGSHSSCKGLVRRKIVSRMQYTLSLLLWLFLDDDCNEDTYDKGFNETIINGERKSWMPEFIKSKLRKAVDRANMVLIRGNSFDLGDTRAEYPLYEFWSVLLWTLRNPAYNFNYKFNQMVGDKYAFKIVLFGRVFGWLEDGLLGHEQTYSWEFGRKL